MGKQWLCYFVLLCLCSFGAGQTISGVVFEDSNNDRKLNAGEKGIANVMVSNQREVVLTDEQGRYTLPVADDTIIFVTQPAEYRAPLSDNNLPLFYYIHKPKGSPKLYYEGVKPTGTLPKSVDFPLRKAEKVSEFSAIAMADPQPETLQETLYIVRNLEELVGTDAAFGITLGDIMFDHLNMFVFYNNAVGRIGIPLYNVIGNHDINFDAASDEESDETFEMHYGPNYYSFDYGDVHFVTLDDVYWDAAIKEYEGRIGEKQLQWLKNDLALVPTEKLVVLSMHIPLYSGEKNEDNKRGRVLDRDKLFTICQDRPHILSLSGHTHTNEHHFLTEKMDWHGKKPHHHLICTTVCGAWWSGIHDERGVPVALQRDGTPNGYQVIKFKGNQYTTQFKASNKTEDYQINIHEPAGVISRAAGEQKIVVNIFDSSCHSQVWYSLDRGPRQLMKNTPGEDPLAVYMYKGRYSRGKPWVQPMTTDHLWTAPLAVDEIGPGAHLLIVTTIDQYGREFSKATIFYVL